MIDKDNAMLMDITYMKPNKAQNNPNGLLYIIWKDLKDGSKHLEVIEDPKYDIYFTKKEFRDHTHNKNYEFLNKCDKVTVPYKDRIKAIVEDGGEQTKSQLRRIYETKNFKALDQFLLYPYVYGADYDIRAWYRWKWLQTMENDKEKPITNGFLDIEVDSLESTGLPNPNTCPIDLVTLIDASTKTSYTFALVDVACKEKDTSRMTPGEVEQEMERRRMYESRMQQQHYLIDHQEDLKKELHELFDELYGDIDYNFFFYHDERKMIAHIFELIHQLKLDFISVWNIGFDIPYFIDRMEFLGMDPREIMCHKDFPIKQCYFKKDTRNFEIKNKSDYFFCTDYTIWRDQMENFAAIRKGQEELRSYRLTAIAKKVIEDEKYDYSDSGSIKTLSYKDYWKYVIYNIKDVLLQLGIERQTGDAENLYMLSYQNATPYESVFRQTVKLRNVQYISYMQDGLVPGENVNMFNYQKTEDEEDEEKDRFEGALVGDPRLILPVGMKLYGRRTNNIFHYSIDMDMSAFYPSSIFAANIDPSTLIFKCICDPRQYDVMGGHLKFNGITHYSKIEATTAFEIGDLAKEIMDNVQTGAVVNTMTKWFNAPTIEELLMDMENEDPSIFIG